MYHLVVDPVPNRIVKLVQHMCAQDSGLIVALYCPDVCKTANELEIISRQTKHKQGVITTNNDDKILLLKYDHEQGIRKGWIHGGQPNGVIFYDLPNVNADDIVFAASRVRRPKGLFKDSQVVSILQNGVGLQSVVGTFRIGHFILEGWSGAEL